MKKYLFCVFISLLMSVQLFAQITEGYITYRHISQKKTQEDLERLENKVRKQVSDPMLQEKVLREIRKSANKQHIFYYGLTFTDKSAVYRSLADNQMMGKMGITATYSDYQQSIVISQGYIFEKAFLIKEKQDTIAWELVDSTRTLMPFEVRMAKATVDSMEVIAWYSPDIPVSGGPDVWHGLPGVILEVYKPDGSAIKFDKFTTVIEKDVLEVPTKGKKLASRAAFDQKLQEAMERLNERARNGEKIKLGSGGN